MSDDLKTHPFLTPQLRFGVVFSVLTVMALGVVLWFVDFDTTKLIPEQPQALPTAERTVASAPKTASITPAPAPSSSAHAVIPPSFDVVRVSPTGDAVVAGRATPGAEVILSSNGLEIGRAIADQAGQFVITPSQRLAEGGQKLTLTEVLPGGETQQSDLAALIVVPPASQQASSSAPLSVGSAPASIAVLTSPNAAPVLLQGPSGPPAGKLGVDVVDYGEHGDIRFSGHAPSNSVVRLYVDNQPIGETKVDADGHWSMSPAQSVAEGQHQLRLDQVNAAGSVLARSEMRFERAPIANFAAPLDRIVVQPAQSLWRIARQAYGHGTRYTDIFAANRNQIRDPDLIYPGQVFTLPTPKPSSSNTSK